MNTRGGVESLLTCGVSLRFIPTAPPEKLFPLLLPCCCGDPHDDDDNDEEEDDYDEYGCCGGGF
jgi:hypothetical protein